MTNLIGVLNAPPIWILGLAHALEASDYSLEEVPTSAPLSGSKRFSAVIVGIADQADLDVVVRLREEDSNSVVITLLDKLSVETAGASLCVGASSFLTLDSPATEVVLALEGALADRTVIPVAVARSLAQSNAQRGDSQIPEEDLHALKALASGETVRELGARLGYSEREMYRRLRRIYGRLGVSDRTDALLRLARLGLLD